MTHFIIAYYISLVNVQTNYCNNNLLILDVKQLNKIMKLYYFYTLKALWDGQGKIEMYYGKPRVKKQLSEKRSIVSRTEGYQIIFKLSSKPLAFTSCKAFLENKKSSRTSLLVLLSAWFLKKYISLVTFYFLIKFHSQVVVTCDVY